MLNFLKNLVGDNQTDFKALLNAGAIIIDVRTPGEYHGGHIKGSVNIPVDQIKQHVSELKKKNKTIITCCRSGARSGMAADILNSAGLTAYNGGPWNSLDKKIQ